MAVTVVIPTYNRITRLLETLKALTEQTFRDFSVIIVDDGSVDGTTEKITTLINTFPFALKIVYQNNAGASVATNTGVRLAPDGLVILFDDDILPSADCIQKHVTFHETHSNSVISGSADTDPDKTGNDVQRYKLYMEAKWREARPDTKGRVKVGFENFIITTANMSFDRSIYMNNDGFNSQLRDGYDVEFGFRILLAGIDVYFDRSISTIHNDQISLRYYAARQRAYATSKKQILSKYPELKKQFGDGEEITVGTVKSFVYSILRWPISIRFIESGFFANFIPRALRYQVYGSTIASLSL